jgi:HEAT repeat protein
MITKKHTLVMSLFANIILACMLLVSLIGRFDYSWNEQITPTEKKKQSIDSSHDNMYSPIQETEDKDVASLETLGTKGTENLSNILKILESADQNEYEIKFNSKTLAIFGAGNIEPIIEYANKLEKSEIEKTDEIIYVLRLIGDPRAVPFFLECLKCDNKKIIESTLLALGEIPDSRAYEPVLALLNEKDDNIRIHAINVLCNLPDPRTLKPLEEMYANNPKGDMQSMLIGALGVLKAQSYVEKFIALYKSLKKDDYLRETLTDALGSLGDAQAFDLLAEGFLDDRLFVSERMRYGIALRKINMADIRKSEVAMKVWKNEKEDKISSDTSLRLLAAIILAESCDQHSLEAINWVLDHGGRGPKMEVVKILGRKLEGRKTAIKRLLDLAARDSDEYVRNAAKYELTKFSFDTM